MLFFFVNFALHSQSSQSDWDLVNNTTFENKSFTTKRQVTYLFAGRNAFVKYNPVSLTLGGLMFFYQKTISTQIGAACPYEINCSNFSKLCIQKYGLLKGIPLTSDRLTRCTRMALIDMVDGVDYSARRGKIFDRPEDYSSVDK